MILEGREILFGILGVAALFALTTPTFIRILMPSTRLLDPQMLAMLETCFAKAGLRTPAVWVFKRQRPGFHNAFVMRRALFVTPSLFTLLTRDELEAVMLHEVSHLKLRHLRKRIAAVFAAFAIASLGVGFLVTLALFIAPKGAMLGVVFLGVAASAYFQGEFVKRAIRRQEFEADAHALELGARSEALASALRKLTPANAKRGTHPDLESRLNKLSFESALREAA